MAFYQTVRAALVKSSGTGLSANERDFAVQQLIDRSVVSTEIVDILRAAGMTTPDISILSDDFLAEVRQMERPNLALKALKKLLGGPDSLAQQDQRSREPPLFRAPDRCDRPLPH